MHIALPTSTSLRALGLATACMATSLLPPPAAAQNARAGAPVAKAVASKTARASHANEKSAHGPGAAESAAPEASAGPDGVINLNTASEQELIRLPGVGVTRARAILELRARMQRFKRVEDLMRVKGIGRKTFRKLRPMLTLQGPTTLVSRAPARR